ncbi:MAG: aspartate kinase [Nitrosopumilaceae archaeon]|nr:aspartate kinase [Nitrosopumilaceae archaeon]
MTKLIIAKFGGSAIGVDGSNIPIIMKRIQDFKKKSAKIIVVFSAPLIIDKQQVKSMTDVILEISQKLHNNKIAALNKIETYENITKFLKKKYKNHVNKLIESYLTKSKLALKEAKENNNFSDDVRSRSLAYSGEILMSHIMKYIMLSYGIESESISFDCWPIITDHNIENANFLPLESTKRLDQIECLLQNNTVICIGGFIGKTTDGIMTTYERGGSDRTAVDLGILFNKKYEVEISFEKDSSVVSADPKIVKEKLTEIKKLSYNEARLAGMFGMKILDPIVIKEIIENGVEIPLKITDMKNPSRTTTIQKKIRYEHVHPLKIVVGKKNCAILRIESSCVNELLKSLNTNRRYNEYVVLSPFTKDGIEFTRMLFLDGSYVKRNERYLLSFDPFANIIYNRGVITLIGDDMWRVQQVVSKIGYNIGKVGLNILNIDAQEETSRIIVIIKDSDTNIEKAINAVHSIRSTIKFI